MQQYFNTIIPNIYTTYYAVVSFSVQQNYINIATPSQNILVDHFVLYTRKTRNVGLYQLNTVQVPKCAFEYSFGTGSCLLNTRRKMKIRVIGLSCSLMAPKIIIAFNADLYARCRLISFSNIMRHHS